MNRYPLWKYIILFVVVVLGFLYALPNVFGEAPVVQVSSKRANVLIDVRLQERLQSVLKAANTIPQEMTIKTSAQGNMLRIVFADGQTQLKAKDIISKELQIDNNSGYVVALNLIRRSPAWLEALGATPMYLGLDLRGGVHFLLQVDMPAALKKKVESLSGDVRLALREKGIRGAVNIVTLSDEQLAQIETNGGQLVAKNAIEVLVSSQDVEKTRDTISSTQGLNELQIKEELQQDRTRLVLTVPPVLARRIQEQALKQNIATLHNRINELGVAEPVIQQQGIDRIVVQLPGLQDIGRAKELLGRTATLEMRLVDVSAEAQASLASGSMVPLGSEKFPISEGGEVIVVRQVLVTGENLTDAQAGFDSNQSVPNVQLSLNDQGGRIMRDVSRENIGKPMAILLFEKGKGTAISVATIRGELGNRFQISGNMNVAEANDLAILLRSGALAAPMEIIEESAIGPSLGKTNIEAGFKSVTYGFLAIIVFMCIYYMMFGIFSSLALAVNLMLLVALLSLLQATLTLPGIAAMALTLGMAIDSNVLINERIREELREGSPPQAAIATGYERAWATIFDSNITTLIAGLALLAYGSGPVRGFAVVHCLGILTSMFSAVFFSRGLANLWYGSRKKLKTVSIGTVWKPETKPMDLINGDGDNTQNIEPSTDKKKTASSGKNKADAQRSKTKKA